MTLHGRGESILGWRGVSASAAWGWMARRGLILAMLFAAGCGGLGEESPGEATADSGNESPGAAAAAHTATPTPVPTVNRTHTPSPTATPGIINPLTGLAVPDLSVLQRWPLSIKVSSYPRSARPQAGLSYADLLIEFYQESGMTRWHAVYLSRDVEKVGPIRSGRKIDVPFMRAYQSLLVFCAEYSATWEYMELQDMSGRLLYVGPVDCPALCRDPSELPINGIYGDTAELRKAAKVLKIPDAIPDLAGMQFSDAPPPMSGGAVSNVWVRFVSDNALAEWRYNPQDKKYYRWSETDKGNRDMAPQTDRLTGEQLSVSNVIVLYANYIRRQQREIYELELFGGGKALLFRDGMMEEGIWRLPNIERPILFYGQDGPFALRPGVTWIGVVEDTSTAVLDGDTLRVEFGKTGVGE
ncbi:MAG: DUF3048 C-terminal domain-containing protein [Anaerolineales bacterium]|nr:DUF3048 C-terminal domain-containing protein [Anaerolineales bacterium]